MYFENKKITYLRAIHGSAVEHVFFSVVTIFSEQCLYFSEQQNHGFRRSRFLNYNLGEEGHFGKEG